MQGSEIWKPMPISSLKIHHSGCLKSAWLSTEISTKALKKCSAWQDGTGWGYGIVMGSMPGPAARDGSGVCCV